MNLSDLVLALAERHLINREVGKLIELGETLERLTQTVVRLSGGAANVSFQLRKLANPTRSTEPKQIDAPRLIPP